MQTKDSSWELRVRPRALPAKLRADFVKRVAEVASPTLQRRDGETEAEHRRRSAIGEWQLKALQTAAMSVESIGLSVSLARGNESFHFRLSVSADKPAISAIAGSVTNRTSRFSAMRSEGGDALFAYQGSLPVTLGRTAGWPLPDIVGRADTDLEVVIRSDFEDAGPLLYGGVAVQNAEALYRAMGQQSKSQTDAHDVLVSESHTVKGAFLGVTFRQPDTLMFAVCPSAEMCREFLGKTLQAETESSPPANLHFRLNIGKLASIGRRSGSAQGELAKAVLRQLERTIYQALVRVKTQGAPDRYKESAQAGFVREVERSGEVRSEDGYVRAVESLEFLKDLNSFSPQMGFQHWLSPDSGVIECRLDATSTRLVIDGTIGRDVCRFLLAHCHAIEARMESFENRDVSGSDIQEQISELKRKREALRAQLRRLKEGR